MQCTFKKLVCLSIGTSYVLQVEVPSEDEMPLGIEAAINEDAFDLDDLSEEERDNVGEATAADLVSNASSFHSAQLEVGKYPQHICCRKVLFA